MYLVVACKISDFIHPSTDVVSVHCCIFYLVVSKMATVKECARCAGWIPGHAATLCSTSYWASTTAHYSATRWRSPSTGFVGISLPGRDISSKKGWQRRHIPLASSFPRHNITGLHVGLCLEYCLPSPVTGTDDLKQHMTDATMAAHNAARAWIYWTLTVLPR